MVFLQDLVWSYPCGVAATYRRFFVLRRPVKGGRTDRYDCVELILFLVFSLAIPLAGYESFVTEDSCLTWLRK